MKNFKIFVLLIYLLFMPYNVQSFEAGIEYDGVYVEYSGLSYYEWHTKANEFLTKARESKTEKEKQDNYSKAAGAYQTLIKIYPGDAVVMATLGHIYGKMHKPVHAKAFLDRGLNLDLRNPTVNYYYGIFREDEKDFRKALKFYNYAYQYGMENDADLNLKLAVVNAKLGEIDKAQFHYQKACELLKDKSIKNNLKQIQDLNK